MSTGRAAPNGLGLLAATGAEQIHSIKAAIFTGESLSSNPLLGPGPHLSVASAQSLVVLSAHWLLVLHRLGHHIEQSLHGHCRGHDLRIPLEMTRPDRPQTVVVDRLTRICVVAQGLAGGRHDASCPRRLNKQ